MNRRKLFPKDRHRRHGLASARRTVILTPVLGGCQRPCLFLGSVVFGYSGRHTQNCLVPAESTSYPPWSTLIALGRWPASFFPSSCRRRRSLTRRPRLPALLPARRSRHHLRESRLRHPRDQRSPGPPRWEPRLFPLRPLQG